jgi:probable DNA metabolism protein
LSELPEIENRLLEFIQYAFTSSISIETNYAHTAVLTVTQVARKVYREKHRMEAFVRFERTKDDLYYSVIEPDHNVIPLISSHFKDRYADQSWLIYDGKRNYGISYDKTSGVVNEVNLLLIDDLSSSEVHDEKELMFQTLWKDYFKSVNITERKNKKLHLQHLPLRYWKYLTEKQH